jgi:hypothetical protein
MIKDSTNKEKKILQLYPEKDKENVYLSRKTNK